ncbi:MAG: hypothetical protein ACXAC2_18415 [Candidatus Kariarchaeaceae archaeon]|jgi:cytochrome d ubiquinol oxidase subunit I
MIEIGASAVISLIIITFGFHVVLLSIEIVMALLIPLLVYLGKQPQRYFKGLIAKRYMNYIIITYATQQIFLTAATVFTLSYYPDTLVFLGKALFYPLGFFILIYGIRLFCISAYWYGWDRLPDNIHYFLGTVFGATGIAILYLDSVILGFLGYPIGVENAVNSEFNQIINFLNPLAIPLFLLLTFFSITTTLTILGYIHAKRIKTIQELEIGEEAVLGRIYLKVASVVSLLILPTLGWYLVSLHQFSRYKFSNIMGGIGYDAEGQSYAWLTVLFLLSFIIYSVTANIWNRKIEQYHSLEHTCERHGNLLLIQVISIVTSLLSIFILNLISQSPYFVSDVELVNELPYLNVNDGVNQKAATLDLYSLTIFAFIPLFAAFFMLLYFFFTGIIGEEYDVSQQNNIAGIIQPKEKTKSLEEREMNDQ